MIRIVFLTSLTFFASVCGSPAVGQELPAARKPEPTDPLASPLRDGPRSETRWQKSLRNPGEPVERTIAAIECILDEFARVSIRFKDCEVGFPVVKDVLTKHIAKAILSTLDGAPDNRLLRSEKGLVVLVEPKDAEQAVQMMTRVLFAEKGERPLVQNIWDQRVTRPDGKRAGYLVVPRSQVPPLVDRGNHIAIMLGTYNIVFMLPEHTDRKRLANQIISITDNIPTIQLLDAQDHLFVCTPIPHVVHVVGTITHTLATDDPVESESTSQSERGASPPERPLIAAADLKRLYEAQEKEAVELAREMKSTPHLAESLKAKLRITVAEAFALRQRLHQAELAEFQARMARVQQTIRTREQIKDAIIDRRVEDLLNPDLNWERPVETDVPGRAAGPVKSAPENTIAGDPPATAATPNPVQGVPPESVAKKRRSTVGVGTEVGVVSATGKEGQFDISCKVPGNLRVGEELQLYRRNSDNPDVRRAVGWVVVVELKDEETAIGRATEMPRVLRNNRYGPDTAFVGDFVFRPNYRPESPANPAGEPIKAASPLEAKPAPSPRIVRSIPASGATNVDPGITEISVTFDQDMSKGMSWTGDAQLHFPPGVNGLKAHWVDSRTCVLPVKLEAGRYYRVGFNSKSHQNFRSLDDVPALPSVICFATSGATAEVAARVSGPVVVGIEPANGARDVDPTVNAIRVTFNVPMGDGMSWTGAGDKYPKIRSGTTARWSADGLTCVLPVTLEPGHDYELGLNSPSHINFQSQWGIPLEPVVYKFRTRGETP